MYIHNDFCPEPEKIISWFTHVQFPYFQNIHNSSIIIISTTNNTPWYLYVPIYHIIALRCIILDAYSYSQLSIQPTFKLAFTPHTIKWHSKLSIYIDPRNSRYILTLIICNNYYRSQSIILIQSHDSIRRHIIPSSASLLS